MLQGIKDYAKCAVRNKATLNGYISAALLIPVYYFEQKTQTPLLKAVLGIDVATGVFLLTVSRAGIGTYKAYRKTRKYIQYHEPIDERLKNREYCVRLGMKMAVKEAGLDHLL